MSKPSREDIERFDREWERSSLRFTRGVAWAVIVGVAIFGLLCYLESLRPPDQMRPLAETPRVFTDPMTGCQYLVYSMRGITPRLGADGSPMCLPMKHREAMR
ncbi:MAG TPA: DUF6440 family protein [Hyphomicrobium sp.]|nr:DUF6440 family protein [Hyphomicrobium sp.]